MEHNRRTGALFGKFLLLLAVMFAAELLIMLFMPGAGAGVSRIVSSSIDALLLALIIAPFIWGLLIRPCHALALQQTLRCSAVLHAMTDGAIEFREDGEIIDANSSAGLIFGCDAVTLLGCSTASILPELLPCLPVKETDNFTAHHDLTGIRTDGGQIPLTITISRLYLDQTPSFLAVIKDNSVHHSYREQLDWQTNHDALTGLPNRSLLMDRVQQGILLAQSTGKPFALYCIDIDHFKFINDSLGHAAGDQVLQEMAGRLSTLVRPIDTVARYGADEFSIIAAELKHADASGMIAQKIRNAISVQPVRIDGHEIAITASVGISMFPRDGQDANNLMMFADTAMHRAKELGRDTFQFFTAEMNTHTLERITLEARLRKALENKEFILLYQPKVNLTTGRITGAEALIRWQNPDLGMVSPASFIPLAEETGLIEPITDWVLATACCQARAWHDAKLPPVSVAVNISTRQFRKRYLIGAVQKALHESKLLPQYLELEITESVLMHDLEEAIPLLAQLKENGHSISLDDFGTGYSSLSYLKRFPVDKLKLDYSFVRDITNDVDSAAIAKSVLAMAHSLKLGVIAEGVETRGQLAYLRRQGYDEAQGYYLSRPVSSSEFQKLLAGGIPEQLLDPETELPTRELLVVDDEPNILRSLERVFALEGYHVSTATNAVDALELLATRKIAVIISDNRMPGMSGIELLRMVKELHPDTVRIIITGYTDLESAVNAINEGSVFKFIAKPWDDKALCTIIVEAFRYHDFLRQTVAG